MTQTGRKQGPRSGCALAGRTGLWSLRDGTVAGSEDLGRDRRCGMRTTQLDSDLVEASFVGGPAGGTTSFVGLESTGFPPVHMSIPDDDGVTRHLYSALMRDNSSLTVFQYLGPLPSKW
jgi:hypothetical protein